MNDNQDLKAKLADMVTANPHSYARMLSSSENADLMRAVIGSLPKLDPNVHTVKTMVWWVLNGIRDFPKCVNCGKPLAKHNVVRLSRGYPKYCSDACMYSSGSYSGAIKASIREKYGVDNAFNIRSVVESRAANKDGIYKKASMTRRKNAAVRKYEKFGKAAFDAFVGYGFPHVGINDGAARYEMNRLLSEQTKDQAPSRIIRSFHRSMYSCRRHGMESPSERWISLKDPANLENGTWRDFYVNRFVYADSKAASEFRRTGIMQAKTILDGFTITHMADCVSYLKPMLAKRLVSKYLHDYDEVFCPFNGFSGIMLGTAYGCGKKFTGRDLNAVEISESKSINEYLTRLGYAADVNLAVADALSCEGTYESLFCCPPYSDKEQWNFDGVGNCIDADMTCDEWIDACVSRYRCRRYVFVVDDMITKYWKNVVETLENKSHFGKNCEYVVVLN